MLISLPSKTASARRYLRRRADSCFCGCERPTWSSCARVSCSVQVHRLKNGGNPEPDRHLLCARCNLSSPKTGHSFSSYCRKSLTKVCVVLHILAQYCPIAELLAPKLHSFRRSWRWSAPLPAARAASVIFGGKTRFLVRKKKKGAWTPAPNYFLGPSCPAQKTVSPQWVVRCDL